MVIATRNSTKSVSSRTRSFNASKIAPKEKSIGDVTNYDSAAVPHPINNIKKKKKRTLHIFKQPLRDITKAIPDPRKVLVKRSTGYIISADGSRKASVKNGLFCAVQELSSNEIVVLFNGLVLPQPVVAAMVLAGTAVKGSVHYINGVNELTCDPATCPASNANCQHGLVDSNGEPITANCYITKCSDDITTPYIRVLKGHRVLFGEELVVEAYGCLFNYREARQELFAPERNAGGD
jgi:hypothetical protein